MPRALRERIVREQAAEEAEVPVHLRQRVEGEREARVVFDRALEARQCLRQGLRCSPGEVVPALEKGVVRLDIDRGAP